MAIQLPNAGLGDGQTGDNEFVMWTKVKDNFSNTAHAASKLVGSGANQVPLSKDVNKASVTLVTGDITSGSIDTLFDEGVYTVAPNILGTPSTNVGILTVRKGGYGKYTSRYLQTITNLEGGNVYYRLSTTTNTEWEAWQSLPQKAYYENTTAAGANLVVDNAGKIMRNTSSERYKDILAPLELDDARYADAMALKPIVYRSKADADNPAYHYYSFSAEELGAYDPAFTLWRETEAVTDADGNVTEQPLAERQAEGINTNALLAMSHAIAIKQGDLIKDLQEQIDVLKTKLEV